MHDAVATVARNMPVKYRGVVQGGIGGTVVQQSVVSKYVATADGVFTDGMESVFHPQIYHKVMQAAIAVGDHYGVHSCGRIRTTEGVESSPFAYSSMNGVAKGVVKCYLHNKVEKTSRRRVPQVLCVATGIGI